MYNADISNFAPFSFISATWPASVLVPEVGADHAWPGGSQACWNLRGERRLLGLVVHVKSQILTPKASEMRQ
ncbi:hypothetical protein CEXT_52891 [Caerostris extrusa]|uniref:Uncharacterized protein n=1 Tax=Caerostris extrusa TaxID=172846 RepID=A0AAV4UJU9_CAEEX|nr:hypothetical protein CEXT_52891 [Caerostris extrusa]